jgi:hypothetical protein
MLGVGKVLMLWVGLLPACLLAQVQCPDSLRPAHPCTDTRAYIPWNPAHWPLKRVRIVLHVLQNPDTLVNFEADSAEHWRYLRTVFWGVNEWYRQPEAPRTPIGSPHVPQGRIRFEYDTTLVFFHKLPGVDYFNPRSVGLQHAKADSLYRVLVENNPLMPHRTDALHIFLGDRRDGSCTGMAQAIGSGKWLLVNNLFAFYRDGFNHWMPSGLMRHELGHCLGLLHPCAMDRSATVEDQCADTHPPGNPNPCCWNGDACSNNIMDYNAAKTHLSAEQLGRCHAYLTGGVARGDIHRALIPDWETYHPADTLRIGPADTATWWGTRRLLGSVWLAPGAHWRIACTVTLPPGAQVWLGPGSVVELLPGASLQCGKGGERWGGFWLTEHARTAAQRQWLVQHPGATVQHTPGPPQARKGKRWVPLAPAAH